MQPSPKPSLSFRKTSKDLFGPRLGSLIFSNELNNHGRRSIEIPTPNFLVPAPRGVVSHLSRDHVEKTRAIKWLNVPLETFLERNPPLPATRPLHNLCGFNPEKHLISLSLRDPSDLRHVPHNGENHVTILSARGAKKVSPLEYKSLLGTIQPDVVFAQSDICVTPPPHSQKRSIKSIERSFNWLLQLLSPAGRPSVLFAQLVGGPVAPARASFSRSLLDPLDEKEQLQVPDLKYLDEGITGYSMDLATLRYSLPEEASQETISDLLRVSLGPLTDSKPRHVSSATNPYQVLNLIREVGVDLFDVQWAFDAAQWGVALDFVFPAPASAAGASTSRRIGHNLYDTKFAMDSSPLADEFLPRSSIQSGPNTAPVCNCIACSPEFEEQVIDHSPLTSQLLRSRGLASFEDHQATTKVPLPMTRAYLHHLLHTHEMLAHAFLVSHNLAVADAFFDGIRRTLTAAGHDRFSEACEDFRRTYPEDGWQVLEEGKQWWSKVDKERGRGRLAREKDADTEGL